MEWSGVCYYGGFGEERERSGVEEEVGEGREECVCNVMKERTEQEEVGEGRGERRRGRERERSGKGRRQERQRSEGGGGRERSKAGREGEYVQKHRVVGGTECSREREERGR